MIVRASTYDEYLGKKIFDIRSKHVGRDRFGAGLLNYPFTRWRHWLYMQTGNNGVCSNLVHYRLVFLLCEESFHGTLCCYY